MTRESFIEKIKKPWYFRLYLLRKIPLAFLAGLRIRELTEQCCVVSLPYKWLTQNPFRSVYFAAQAMAAEMSTGVLGMMAVQRVEKISMLVVEVKGEFVKKAASGIWFACENGIEIINAVEETVARKEAVTVQCRSVGRLSDGTVVSNFLIVWSFKLKSK